MSGTRALRVAHIVTNLEVGGAETALERLSLAADPSVLTNAIWSLRDIGTIGRRLRAAGIPTSAAGMRPGGRMLTAWRTLRSEVSAFMPDILQGWMYHGNLAASALAWQLPQRPRLLWNIRGSLRALSNEKWSTRLVIAASRLFAGSVARIVNNSASSVQDHIKLGYPSGRWCVIPNGFDTERFRPRPEQQGALREQLAISSPTTIIIGAVGRNHAIKGHRFFIEAIKDLARRGHDVTGVLVGPGWEPESAAARALNVGNDNLFRCLGTLERTELLYSGLDIMCLPSLSEGFPNVVAEAMSCGVPCVVTDVGDVAAIVADTAELAAAGDVTSLRDALERCIVAGVNTRHARGEAARARIVQCYSEVRMARAYQDLYQEVMAEKSRSTK
jgi:glycosyltransferase involved in cell wall biosynthesis